MLNFDLLRSGDRRTLAKAITLIESTRNDHRFQAENLLESIMPATGHSLRLGISGVPGVGKSTFIDAFGRLLIERGLRLAVLTVDPSSTISGGAILGDKTRMEWLAAQPSAFIRPSPAGLTLGGVTRRTRETILVCEAAGYDVVIVETVGIGQSESLVAEMTDVYLLLLLPGAGDELQGIKRGVMELADLVVINKADGDFRSRAEMAVAELRSALHLIRPRLAGWSTPVLAISSLRQRGIDRVWDRITEYHKVLNKDNGLQKRRRAQSKGWLLRETGEILVETLRMNPIFKKQLSDLQEQVLNEKIPASVAAAKLARDWLSVAHRT